MADDVKARLADPDFNKLPVPDQRQALSKLDPRFGEITDDQYKEFRQQVLSAAPPKPSVPGAIPTGDKPQEMAGKAANYMKQLTPKDYVAAGVNAIPTAGAAVGTGVAGPLGTAGGAVIGKGIQIGLEKAVGSERLSGPHIQVDPPPGSFREGVGSVLKEGLEQTAFEGGGRLVGSLLRGVLGGAFSAEGRATENAIIKAANQKWGLNLSAHEVAGKRGILKQASEYSFLSQMYIRKKWGEGAERGIRAINDVLARVHPPTSPTAAGETMQGLFKMSNDLWREESKELYENQLKPVAANIPINMRGVKAEAKKILDEIKLNKKQYPDIGGLGPKAETILQNLANGPDEAPFSVAHHLRSNLMDVTPDPNEMMANRAQGVAKNMVTHLTEAIDNSLSAASPQAQKLWKTSRQFYKDGGELFGDTVIRGMMDKQPEKLVESIQPHAEKTVARIRRAILEYPRRFGTPKEVRDAELGWRQFQEQFTRTKLLGDPGNVGLEPNPETLAEISKRMDSMGQGVLDEVFGGTKAGRETQERLRDISKSFARVQKLPPEMRKYVTEMFTVSVSMLAKANHSASGEMLGGLALVEVLPTFVAGAIRSRVGTQYLLDGVGGLISAAKNRPMQSFGKGLIKLQEKTITSPRSYKEMGPAIANLMRAYEIVQADKKQIDAQRQKATEKEKKAPPGAGYNPDDIHIVLDKWMQ